MSRRKTVQLNLPVVLPLIKKTCRSNVVFCEKMGRNSGQWVSDWQRTPAKNLPSPEEAARMCALLQVEPEEIIATPEDIALVRGLIEQEREAQKKDTTPQGDVLSPLEAELMEYVRELSEEQKRFLLVQMQTLKKQGSPTADSQ